MYFFRAVFFTQNRRYEFFDTPTAFDVDFIERLSNVFCDNFFLSTAYTKLIAIWIPSTSDHHYN